MYVCMISKVFCQTYEYAPTVSHLREPIDVFLPWFTVVAKKDASYRVFPRSAAWAHAYGPEQLAFSGKGGSFLSLTVYGFLRLWLGCKDPGFVGTPSVMKRLNGSRIQYRDMCCNF